MSTLNCTSKQLPFFNWNIIEHCPIIIKKETVYVVSVHLGYAYFLSIYEMAYNKIER